MTLNISSHNVGDSNDENNFSYTFVIRLSRLCKALTTIFSANIKLSKTQLFKIGQWDGFWSRHLAPLIKFPLIGKAHKTFAKSVLIPLRLAAATSATNAAIHKKMFASDPTTLITFNKEMNNVIK